MEEWTTKQSWKHHNQTLRRLSLHFTEQELTVLSAFWFNASTGEKVAMLLETPGYIRKEQSESEVQQLEESYNWTETESKRLTEIVSKWTSSWDAS